MDSVEPKLLELVKELSVERWRTVRWPMDVDLDRFREAEPVLWAK